MKRPVAMGTGASRARSGGIGFDVPEDEIDGECSARALGRSVLTGNGPLGDVGCDVRDAVDYHFDETMQRRSVIHLHFVHDEIVLT